jgi:cell fate (sporulation/competence/biofilm development) regulator YlbF (YheA/YmcA/DUF963 family)
MENILQLAEQLGKELSKQPQVQRYLAVQDELSKDTAAQKLINEFEEQAQKIAGLESELKPVEPSDKHKLGELQSKISGHDTIKKFMGAQVEYTNLIRQLNQKIMNQLPLREPAEPKPI